MSQVPHSSATLSPPHVPAQSCTQSLEGSLSQVPHSSATLSPPQTPSQSNATVEPHTLSHPPTTALPPHVPAQSCTHSLSPVFPATQVSHSSSKALPPQSPLQSCTQSLGLSHTPHSSREAPSQLHFPSLTGSQTALPSNVFVVSTVVTHVERSWLKSPAE